MKITFTSLHQIDHSKDTIVKINIDNQSEVLQDYISKLMEEIFTSPNRKAFYFQSDTTEIRAAISSLLVGKFDEAASICANRLLREEIKAQERINHLGREIQKGSLFQAIFENEDGQFIILSKADHNEFVDETDFLLHKGLPWKKRVFKAFIARVEDNYSLHDIFIHDKTGRMSEYWWNYYLELTEQRNSTHNTERSVDIIDRKVLNPIKSKFPADHTILRNSFLGYFRSKEEFDLNEFLDNVFENYSPVDEKLPIDKLKDKVKDLPKKWDFDTRFSISKKDIKKNRVHTIYLAENLDLRLKGEIELDDIQPDIDSEGHKYIKIKSEEGYKYFKKPRQ